MSKLFLSLPVFLMAVFCAGQSPVQLATPLLKFQSVFFKTVAVVEIKFAQQGTQIHYTINNRPPTIHDKIYRQPIKIKKSFTTIKAITAGQGFLPSEIVSATFIKDGFKIKSAQQTQDNERFQGNGADALIDNEGGIADMNSKTWMGYQQDAVEINLELEKKQQISSVLINCLQDQGSWIFLPAEISFFYFDERKQSFELSGTELNTATEKVPAASCTPVVVTAGKKAVTKKIKIILKGIKELPEWHDGKGKPGWLFIDEIKVY